jgi:hypothetical protein
VVDRSTVNGHHPVDDLPLVESETDIGSLLDNILRGLESGVEMALHRAQAWSKFAKDLVSYFEKRTTLCRFFVFVTFLTRSSCGNVYQLKYS